MRRLLRNLPEQFLGFIHSGREMVQRAMGTALRGLRRLHALHRRMMLTNPVYPIALLSIGKSLIRLVTHSTAIAAAAIALLAAILQEEQHGPDWHWDTDY